MLLYPVGILIFSVCWASEHFKRCQWGKELKPPKNFSVTDFYTAVGKYFELITIFFFITLMQKSSKLEYCLLEYQIS